MQLAKPGQVIRQCIERRSKCKGKAQQRKHPEENAGRKYLRPRFAAKGAPDTHCLLDYGGNRQQQRQRTKIHCALNKILYSPVNRLAGNPSGGK